VNNPCRFDSDLRHHIKTQVDPKKSGGPPIRKILREVFAGAGLPYFNPHSFRHTLVHLIQEMWRRSERFKAWSQNLGHEKVLTTFLSYGGVDCRRQGEIIRDLATPQRVMPTNPDEIAEAVYKKLRSSGVDV
jgi:integrase